MSLATSFFSDSSFGEPLLFISSWAFWCVCVCVCVCVFQMHNATVEKKQFHFDFPRHLFCCLWPWEILLFETKKKLVSNNCCLMKVYLWSFRVVTGYDEIAADPVLHLTVAVRIYLKFDADLFPVSDIVFYF